MESSGCHRDASAEQSTRPYSLTVEWEPVRVKDEPAWGECGGSEAAAAVPLHAAHEVKVEFEIEPDQIQQQDIAFSMQGALNGTKAMCKMEPADGAAPECPHTRPGEGPQCNMIHDQQSKSNHRNCFVKRERILVEDLPTYNTCLETKNTETGYLSNNSQHSENCDKPSYDVCKSQVAQESHLAEQKRTHTNEKPFTCDICESQFDRKSFLLRHKRTHTGEKPFSCDVCESQFSQKSHLARHRQTHTGEKPFSCDICKSQFSLKFVLDRHRRTHTGEKPFSCDVCKLQFSQKCHLAVHRRTHTGEKPYSCRVCNKQFARKSRLTCHVVTHSAVNLDNCDT